MVKTNIRHNGTVRNITDFSFDGVMASGYIGGKRMEGKVENYVYSGYKNKDCGDFRRTGESMAKHYLIDLHDMMYGNTILTRSESGRLSNSKIRVRHTRIERLGDGRCKATGIINGTLVTIYYDGYAESNYMGEIKKAKPWLRDVREDLESKYRFEMKKKANPAIEELKVLHEKDAQMVIELLREAGLVTEPLKNASLIA